MKLNKSKFKAIHPGELLKSELIDERKLTITSIAGMLKVSRQALSNVLKSKASISPEMAWRISIVFGGNPEIWMRLQTKFDLQKAGKRIERLKLVPLT